MSSSEASKTWLSQDAYDRLQAELDEHIADRPVIAAEINARREEGDLARTAATTPPARSRASRRAGSGTCRSCCVPPRWARRRPPTRSAPGTVVTIYFDDDQSDTETFLLGSREISSTTDLTVYSPESALGQAILGAGEGQTVTYTAPSGADIKVTVVKFDLRTARRSGRSAVAPEYTGPVSAQGA